MTSLDRRLPARFVPLEGCFNFRDLGGYPTASHGMVRPRVLYRSDGLHRLSRTGQEAFAGLGVATVIDLRTVGEVSERAWRPPTGWPGRALHVPLRESIPVWESYSSEQLAAEDFAILHYLETAQRGAAALRRVLTVLTEPGSLPAAFYCAAGKDRTGVVAGLVLALLGVPAEVVGEDYALSKIATKRWEASVAAGARDDTQTAWAFVPAAMLVAEARTMLGFLAQIEELHGSVEEFASAIGVADATVERLRDALLE